jgi:hypothetical protein
VRVWSGLILALFIRAFMSVSFVSGGVSLSSVLNVFWKSSPVRGVLFRICRRLFFCSSSSWSSSGCMVLSGILILGPPVL